MAFDSVLGHERIRSLLGRAVAAHRVPPALLFAGPEGVGKRTLALALAQALLCERPGQDACGHCGCCRRVVKGLHPDFMLVRPETAAIKIEQVRDLVREVAAPAFEGRARAFVVDDAHTMTEQAQNALLKSLEEPPARAHLVLVSDSPQALLQTIRSRCQTLRFGPLPLSTLEARLAAEGLSPAEARMRAVVCAGSLGAALTFEGEGYRAARDRVLELLEAGGGAGLARMDAADVLAEADDPMLVLVALRALLRDVAAARSGAGPDELLNADLAPRLLALATGPLGARALSLADSAEETRLALKQNANRLLAMDALLDSFAP